MDEFLKFYNENHTKQQINVIYDDKKTRRRTNICGYETPHLYTHYMRCEGINDKGDIEIGGIAEFSIEKGKYVDLGCLCSNKYPSDSRYTHNGAATILLNILKKYVDFNKKIENPSFYLVLLAAADSKEYYLRQNLQTIDNRYFTYGEKPQTSRKKLTPTQKELLLLRGDDDGTLPTDFFKKKRKSKRLNPKKKYDYTLKLFIDKKDYETSLLSLGEDIETSEDDTASKDIETSKDDTTDGNSLFECILL